MMKKNQSLNKNLVDLPYLNKSLVSTHNEYWVDCLNYDGVYQISNLGRIKSLSRMRKGPYSDYLTKDRILSQQKTHKGQLQVRLSENGSSISFLVLTLMGLNFLGRKEPGERYYRKNNITQDNRLINIGIIKQYNLNKESQFKPSFVYSSINLKTKDKEEFISSELIEIYGLYGYQTINKVANGSKRHLSAYGFKWEKKEIEK